MPRVVKSATFVHACFGSIREAAGVAQRPDERRVDDDGAGGELPTISIVASAGTSDASSASASSGVRSGG